MNIHQVTKQTEEIVNEMVVAFYVRHHLEKARETKDLRRSGYSWTEIRKKVMIDE